MPLSTGKTAAIFSDMRFQPILQRWQKFLYAAAHQDFLQKILSDLRTQRDIFPQAHIKERHILRHQRDQPAEIIAPQLTHLSAVIGDAAGIFC